MTRSRVMGTPCDHESFFARSYYGVPRLFLSRKKKKKPPDRSLRYCPLEVTKPRDKDICWAALQLFITYVQRKYTHPVSLSQFWNPPSRLFQMSAEAPASPSFKSQYTFSPARALVTKG